MRLWDILRIVSAILTEFQSYHQNISKHKYGIVTYAHVSESVGTKATIFLKWLYGFISL